MTLRETLDAALTDDFFAEMVANEYTRQLQDNVKFPSEKRLWSVATIPLAQIDKDADADTVLKEARSIIEERRMTPNADDMFNVLKPVDLKIVRKNLRVGITMSFREANEVLNSRGMLSEIHNEVGAYPRWRDGYYEKDNYWPKHAYREAVTSIIAPYMNRKEAYDALVEDYGRMLEDMADNVGKSGKFYKTNLVTGHRTNIDISGTDITVEDAKQTLGELKSRAESTDRWQTRFLYGYQDVAIKKGVLSYTKETTFEDAHEFFARLHRTDFIQDQFGVSVTKVWDGGRGRSSKSHFEVVDHRTKDQKVKADKSSYRDKSAVKEAKEAPKPTVKTATKVDAATIAKAVSELKAKAKSKTASGTKVEKTQRKTKVEKPSTDSKSKSKNDLKPKNEEKAESKVRKSRYKDGHRPPLNVKTEAKKIEKASEAEVNLDMSDLSDENLNL